MRSVRRHHLRFKTEESLHPGEQAAHNFRKVALQDCRGSPPASDTPH
ncbi:MAG: hypothetical protein MZV64_19700 [Ignavibacteriales bacterium]|nr:hypothetical protein [Ignavibacteriales bacterium]